MFLGVRTKRSIAKLNESRQTVAAVRLGHDCSRDACVRVTSRHRDAGKHASLRIIDDARDDAIGRLRHRGATPHANANSSAASEARRNMAPPLE